MARSEGRPLLRLSRVLFLVSLWAGLGSSLVSSGGCTSLLPNQTDGPHDGTSSDSAPSLTEADFFTDLPKGYEYVAPDPEIEEEVRARFAASGGGEIVQDLFIRDVEHGSVPTATVMVVAFNEQATSGDLQGFVRGMEEDMGVKGKPVDLDGVSALYLDANPKTFLYVGDTYVITVFGQNEGRLKAVTDALASAAP